ncbi:MAG: FG-GAP repeat protein [Fimbriimonadaceae bacterium]|nr:FG-GAP repeat protein [Chitinophagales bacterium]
MNCHKKIILFFIISAFLQTQFLFSQIYYEGAGWTAHGSIEVSAFGWSMSNAGDVNGDGYDDLIVSAIDHSEPIATEEEEGKLYLYYGSPDGLDTIPDWTYQPNQASAITGFSTDGGDLNGDGYSDIVIGCLQWTGTATDEGKAILFYGGLDGPGDEPDWEFYQGQEGALVGSGVALSGDINNDGYNDLFVGAKMWDGGNVDEGKSWMFYGSETGPISSGWTWEANQDSSISGYPISYAGDVDDDGYDDVIIGANQHDFYDLDDGMAVCFYGSELGLSLTPNWQVSKGQKKSNFGHWVDGAGDVNGDGYSDVIISALLYENDEDDFNEGAVFVYHGSALGLQTTESWSLESNQVEAQLGYCTAGAGDINNDGYDDIIAGAKYWTNGELEEGGAFVAFGSDGGLEDAWCWKGEGNQPLAYYGRHVGGNGDFNGDGYGDFLVGAYRYTDVYDRDGRGYCYYGGPREAAFHYEEDSFCLTSSDPIAIIDGLAGGLFSASSPDVVFIDAATGEIDLSETGYGNFEIYYTIPDALCSEGNAFDIHIGTAPIATFGYATDSFPPTAPNQFPDFGVGASAGTFSSTPIGLILNTFNGEINCSESTAGTYIVMNTVDNGFCSVTDSFTLTIQAPCVPPNAPYVQDVSTTYVVLVWNEVPYATSYTIQVQSEVDTVFVFDHSDTSIYISGLTAYTNYRAWVVSNCDDLSSSKSEKTDFQTNPNAIEEIAGNYFTIYPNPANDKLTIQFNTAIKENFVLQLINAEGKILSENQINVSVENIKKEILLYQYTDGIYLIKCIFENEIVIQKLVIVKE